VCTTELTHPGPPAFLSDHDVSDPAQGISCTNLKLAETEVRKLRDLYSAVQWLRGRVPAAP
jgi:hypothetical protein